VGGKSYLGDRHWETAIERAGADVGPIPKNTYPEPIANSRLGSINGFVKVTIAPHLTLMAHEACQEVGMPKMERKAGGRMQRGIELMDSQWKRALWYVHRVNPGSTATELFL
jgi:hypothetical protein